MIVWPGIRRTERSRGGIPIANRVAHFDAAVGITSAGGFASQWNDISGNARHLLQATGANQPIHLPFSGTKYGWSSGVAGNYFSTPDSAAASVTGSIEIQYDGALDNWAAVGQQTLVSKLANSGQYGYQIYIAAGQIFFRYSSNGTALTNAASTSVFAFSAGLRNQIKVTRDSVTGDVNFYTATDGVTWAKLGNTVSTAAGAMFDGTDALRIHDQNGAALATGKCYRAIIKNGIDGTTVVDFDPSRWTSGTTFTASTGETWTINSTGSKPAQIVDRPSLLFDGAAHFMKCNAFTLNQPETLYLVLKQVTWTLSDYFCDGNTADRMVIGQVTGTPKIRGYAGVTGTDDANLAVGVTGVVGAVFNGANSSLQVSGNAAVVSNFGTNNAGGFTLGSGAHPLFHANIQVYEALIYNVAHNAATRANIIRALMAKHGVA